MRKIKFILLFWFCLGLGDSCWALELDVLKEDFLRGNYRRVIFEGQAQLDWGTLGNTDELNYLLGLSYLKEAKLDLAQACFKRILSNPGSKLKAEAGLALADSDLVSGRFQEAEDSYNKLIAEDSNSKQKPAILYRLNQLELKRGNNQKAYEYLARLKNDFPLSPELKLTKGIATISMPEVEAGVYSVQVGFFSKRLNANNFKNKLLSRSYPAYVESFGAGFKVKVGKLKFKKQALDLEAELIRDGFQTKVCP